MAMFRKDTPNRYSLMLRQAQHEGIANLGLTLSLSKGERNAVTQQSRIAR